MTDIVQYLKFAAAVLPFVIFALLNMKANIRKINRSRQFLMPAIALVFCIAIVIFLNNITSWLTDLWNLIISLISSWLPSLAQTLEKLDISLWIFFFANAVFMLVYIIFKKIVVTILNRSFKTGNAFYETIAGILYDYEDDSDKWFVRNKYNELRKLFKAIYIVAVIISCLVMILSAALYKDGQLTAIFYPVFGVILIGEIFFFSDGMTKAEYLDDVEAEEDASRKVINYSLMRNVLKLFFHDKLNADNSAANETEVEESIEQIVDDMTDDADPVISDYAHYMQIYASCGNMIDRNYLYSGLDILKGRSLLFNNPFYHDFIPYIFYPLNRILLEKKKVLIILGRNGIEEDISDWVVEGMSAVNSVETLWNVENLSDYDPEKGLPDIGIISRSAVHDFTLHNKCQEFFGLVRAVVIIEPSKLVSTAQIGLNSIAKRISLSEKNVSWIGIDKNCDGLVDALSHAVLANITEVSATEAFTGMSSYMMWNADGDHMQHRLIPNISRYLGFGTELSFAALKNQIPKTYWYGGETFPVKDMHWIDKQYYAELLKYAELPINQDVIDERLEVSDNIWKASKEENAYITIEDESYNMFEIRREFSTRASKQGFINVLSEDYMLKDYMSENAGIFSADPKAIPSVSADYVRSPRNVALRLILTMSCGAMREDKLKDELTLIGYDSSKPVTSFWNLLCESINPISAPAPQVLTVVCGDETYEFDEKVVLVRPKYDINTGRTYNLYYINDRVFLREFVSQLRNASCIGEDEKGETHYIGAELKGHIFQKYLPGQFFTFEGKYYEFQNVTADGQMILRRAADHILGRPAYRQRRIYNISAIAADTAMGSVIDVGGMTITRMNADMYVDTPGYWDMPQFGDFENAKYISVNSIPRRVYNNKSVLRIDLPEFTSEDGETNGNIRYTIAILFNEILRSMFAENQPYISAVLPGNDVAAEKNPLTYTLESETCDLGENSLYIIEDSQLDIGLLVAVERCIKRIFEIMCDYLDWHVETLDNCLNPKEEKPEPEYRIHIPKEGEMPEIEEEEEGRKGLFGRKRKDKKKKPDSAAVTEEAKPEEAEAETAVPEDSEVETAVPEDSEVETDVPEEPETIETEESVTSEAEESVTSETEQSVTSEVETESDKNPQMLFSISYRPRYLYDETADANESGTGDDAADTADTSEAPAGEENGSSDSPVDGMDVEYESDEAVAAMQIPEKKPYNERYYLLFGKSELSVSICPCETLKYLQGLGYGNSSLKQARDNKDMAENIARQKKTGEGHQCDFCGRDLKGTQYEVLADGRERCTACSRSAIRTEKEFKNILKNVLENMETFYGVKITVPVTIRAVNAKKLHKCLGKTFIPTGNMDGRVLGVAIKNKNGYSLLVENGSPRIMCTMTLAHELTHIWQYLNWNDKMITYMYGKDQVLQVYEGMAKWAEIQYAYLIGENVTAKREEFITLLRQDEYGFGFKKYLSKYPLSEDYQKVGKTPFKDVNRPL